ncbi:MAG TPA: type IV toxin-antitoxin system AbiEi family antitoxin [Pirellulales bacterium]|nr:type IV toxin-antitoxin system AbiEi family antitoxin [Pirellulales bacterium]
MANLQDYLESQLVKGRAYFSKSAALAELPLAPQAFQAAAARLIKKGRLACPRRGFYLILRPEDRLLGAPEPARWIDPLMMHLRLDYRISLLRAAAFHGSAHQAAMVFQVITPRQLAKIAIGRQQVEFLYQAPANFAQANQPQWLSQLKTEAGFAKVAGVELTLLDICRYFHHAAGISGAAQAVHDLGKQADSRTLAEAAAAFENSAVRRLGYLLERFGHDRQANALRNVAERAKSFSDLDPSVKPIAAALRTNAEKNQQWKLVINVPVEIDA